MAVSAFKSTSKRGNLGTSSTNNIYSAKENNSENSSKKFPPRRSRSVSALSRNHLDISSSSSTPLSGVIDFLNKRDNPLFCSSSSSPPDAIESEKLMGIAKFDENTSNLRTPASELVSSGVLDSRRGRSVSRIPNSGNQLQETRKEMGRSLSRVDIGRRPRSVSRGHYGNSESEVEKEYCVSSSLRNKSNRNSAPNTEKKVNGGTRASELSDHSRRLQTWSSQHPPSEPSDGSASYVQTPNWEDGISASSFSEAEEKTVKAVFEQMKIVMVRCPDNAFSALYSLSQPFQSDHPAGDTSTGGIFETVRSEVRRAISEIRNDLESAIRRKNPTIITAANVADIPPELVNPDAVELVSDIRREYARKLEQSQERARKLRADLAVEEHREKELSRILKEILPDPTTPDMQKPRPRRKTSIERRKMSKRLTDEAMTYFDECVSISTFDSSDFSSPEDPPLKIVTATSSVDGKSFLCGSSSAATSYCPGSILNHSKELDAQVQCSRGHEDSYFTANSSSKDPSKGQDNLAGTNTDRIGNFQFSFARESTETLGLHHDIRNYIKKFEKEIEKDGVDCRIARSNYYNADEYRLQVSAESLLFDRVILKNRVESGGLLLCGNGITI
ncbi:hypothetical protein HHK36_017015 [Tetracentron sinense]|uniref:Uncharacterized protein n=1 Tax=Tetracentron sinense TaxID=13715 RepID=A0A835DF91_TETSI|nr:hypothetical protein HHK36_017015 [Tetracentron sinense]